MISHSLPEGPDHKHTVFPLIVGTRNWQHPEWLGSYYPPDLPQEWQLSFYANEFNGVLLPATVWQQAIEADVRKWREETPDGFGFLLEAGSPTHQPPPITDLLGDRFAGWVSTTRGFSGPLYAAPLSVARNNDGADILLVTAADLAERRRLGTQLRELAQREMPFRALIATGAVEAAAVQELRVLAELVGLA